MKIKKSKPPPKQIDEKKEITITKVNNIFIKKTSITKANNKLEGNENKHHQQMKIKKRKCIITNGWEEGNKNNCYQRMKTKRMKQTSVVDERKKTKINIIN